MDDLGALGGRKARRTMSDTSSPTPARDRAAADDPPRRQSRGLFHPPDRGLWAPDQDRGDAADPAQPLSSMPGVRNLRKLRVEDVAVPKADIVGCLGDVKP